MAPRTSQLQIRVSPEQKTTLKRLAGQAGLTVSAYVLGQALPAGTRAIAGAFTDIRAGKPGALLVLRRQLEVIPGGEPGDWLESVDVSDLTPLLRNRIAGIVEEVAHERNAAPPPWTATVEQLPHPHFRWPLRSLRPYQLRASPVSLKRRNIFDPAAVEEGNARSPGPAPLPLDLLQRRLERLELDVEFYFVGNAILHQTFPARPASGRPVDMFAPEGPLLQAVSELSAAEGWPANGIESALREAVRGSAPGQGFVDLPRLKAFTPPLGYALAMKAAAGVRAGAGRADDLRYLSRSLNLSSADAAMTVVTGYLAERHLPADTRDVLARMFTT
jgi:hypothetical protein